MAPACCKEEGWSDVEAVGAGEEEKATEGKRNQRAEPLQERRCHGLRCVICGHFFLIGALMSQMPNAKITSP